MSIKGIVKEHNLHRRGHKTVVFILDEFDLFAKPFKQTVLYNLLDALQTSSVQVGPLIGPWTQHQDT